MNNKIKPNLRLTGIGEISVASMNSMKNVLTGIIAENTPNRETAFNTKIK